MTRRILFRLHWILGLTSGVVLAVMGVTGALMSFEDEIMAALSPGIVTIAPAAGPRLPLDALVAAASRQRGGLRVQGVTVEAAPTRAWAVHFAAVGRQRRGERSYIDPRNGRLLGKARGAGFFRTVQDLHRWLALPGAGDGIGRQVTGASAIALVFFALSGLYLRWPRSPLDWRGWLVLDLRRTGRNFHRMLHAVIGGWVLLFYLLSALTGLWWSYDWYRAAVRVALTGAAGPARVASTAPPETPPPALSPAWRGLLRETGGRFEEVVATIPAGPGPIVMRVVPRGARYDRMTDELRFDAVTGALLSADRYAARGPGETIATSMYPLHTGAFFGMPGRIALFLTSLTMPLFTVTGLLMYLGRRRRSRRRDPQPAGAPVTVDRAGILIVHASQTGTAERLAREAAGAFPGATLRPLDAIGPADLRAARRVLIVAATYGDGEPPDRVRRFAATTMGGIVDLAGVDYAVLALGDREYPDFCAFGRRIDAWLYACGARRLADPVLADGDDGEAERRWRHLLRTIGGDVAEAIRADHADWPLVARTWINRGSPGAPVYHLAIAAPPGTAWTPGAIAEILPRHDPARISLALAAAGLPDDAVLQTMLADRVLPDPGATIPPLPPLLPHRDYSIASIASSGRVELLVRQCVAADGRPGIGSGWLTSIAATGDPIRIRLRENSGFAPPADRSRPLILIGNGTGLAGLMAHLRERRHDGGAPAWLLYGERSPEHDRPFAAELEAMRTAGVIAQTDLAFSRDAARPLHVQHLLAGRADMVRDWVGRGAAIYVCGSLSGMAPAVDAALRAIAGDERIDTMTNDHLYCRDVY